MVYQSSVFGARLRALRKQAGETQKELAELLGVKPNQIGEMEHGRGGSTYAKLAQLCTHYHVSADYLLGLIDEPRPLETQTGDQPSQ